MGNPHLLLTCDYEVFGDGGGDLDACLVRPTERLLEVCERHGYPLTLFVDASELLAMRGTEDAVYRVEAQLMDAVARGHAVQLHLHPQWDGARRVDGRWKVDPSRWRIGDLPHEAAELIARGKAYLEEVAGAPVDVFRAGAWAIQPAGPVLRALAAQGFRMESSVAPGMHWTGPRDHYDFRKAPDKGWWRTGEDVVDEGDGLVEVPIATAWIGRRRHLAARGRRPTVNPEGCGCGPGRKSATERARTRVDQVRNLGRSMLDVTGLDTAGLEAVAERWCAHDEAELPVVAISHCKNFTDWSAEQLDRWLACCAFQPATYASWAEAALG